MKKICIIGMIILMSLLGHWGCESISPGGIEDVRVDSEDSIFCDQNANYCCRIKYKISFIDSTSVDGYEHYYWAELSDGKNKSVGKPSKLIHNSSQDRKIIEAYVFYFDSLLLSNTSDIFVTVKKADYLLNGWKPIDDSVLSVGKMSSPYSPLVTSFANDCESTCCTDDDYTLNRRWYVSAIHEEDMISTISSDIIISYPNKLCQEFGNASSNAHVNMANNRVLSPSNGLPLWTQSGFVFLKSGANNLKTVYIEVNGTTRVIEYVGLPSYTPGDYETFRIAKSCDTCSIYFNWSSSILPYIYSIDTIFNDIEFNSATWEAEILGWETDMVGSSNYPFVFNDCGYRLSSDLQGSSLRDPNWTIISSNKNWWDFRQISPTAFEVWDVTPIP